MPYRVDLTRAAGKGLRPLPYKDKRRIAQAIDALAQEPRPQGAKPLKGSGKGLLRIQVGNYRIVYQVEDESYTILVVNIGHRRDVYQRL